MSSVGDTNPSQIPENLKERLKASYDAIAPKYNEWTTKNHSPRMEYLAKVLDLLPMSDPSQQLRFLELGCGSGLPVTQKLLSYPTVHVTANDLSTTQIELAKSHLLGFFKGNGRDPKRLSLLEGDMTKPEFPNESFDAVFAFYSIIHLPRAEQTEMIGKITRWLKPGGYLLANFVESESEAIITEKWLDQKDWMFWSGWGKDGTLKVVEEAGMEVVVGEVRKDAVDGSFIWIIAKR